MWLATDPTETMNANYGEKVLKIQNTLSCWEKRRLSLLEFEFVMFKKLEY